MIYTEINSSKMILDEILSETDETITLKYEHNETQYGLVIKKNSELKVENIQTILNFYKAYLKNCSEKL